MCCEAEKERAGVGNTAVEQALKEFFRGVLEAPCQSKPTYTFKKAKFTGKFPKFPSSAFLLTHETRTQGPLRTEQQERGKLKQNIELRPH